MNKKLIGLTILGALGMGIIGGVGSSANAVDTLPAMELTPSQSSSNQGHRDMNREEHMAQKNAELAEKLGMDLEELESVLELHHSNLKNSGTKEEAEAERDRFMTELSVLSGKSIEEVEAIMKKDGKGKGGRPGKGDINLTQEELEAKKAEKLQEMAETLGVNPEELSALLEQNGENMKNAETREEAEAEKERFMEQLSALSGKSIEELEAIMGKDGKGKGGRPGKGDINLTQEEIEAKKAERLQQMSENLGVDLEELSSLLEQNREDMKNATSREEAKEIMDRFMAQLEELSGKTLEEIISNFKGRVGEGRGHRGGAAKTDNN